jgi:hypothetical protein
MGGVVIGFIGSMRMTSEGKLTDELSCAQRALVNVWEVCLHMEGP